MSKRVERKILPLKGKLESAIECEELMSAAMTVEYDMMDQQKSCKFKYSFLDEFEEYVADCFDKLSDAVLELRGGYNRALAQAIHNGDSELVDALFERVGKQIGAMHGKEIPDSDCMNVFPVPEEELSLLLAQKILTESDLKTRH
jgi:hypothetical protein